MERVLPLGLSQPFGSLSIGDTAVGSLPMATVLQLLPETPAKPFQLLDDEDVVVGPTIMAGTIWWVVGLREQSCLKHNGWELAEPLIP